TDANSLVLVARVEKVGAMDIRDTPGRQCARVMILDKSTGSLASQIDLDGSCPDVATLWRSSLIFAGKFDAVFGQARNKIAGISLLNGTVTNVGSNFGTAFPAYLASPMQEVADLKVEGNTLYVAGRLAQDGTHMAAIDLLRGTVTAWRPEGRLSASVPSWQVSRHQMMVTNKSVVVVGCLGDLGSTNFVAYDRVTGTRAQFDTQMVLQSDYCTVDGFKQFKGHSFGRSIFVTGVESVRGQTVPGYAWINETGALVTPALALTPMKSRWFVPERVRFFPQINRMFVGGNGMSSLLNGREMGPYLSADESGNAKATALVGAVEGWRPGRMAVKDGEMYISGLSESPGSAPRTTIHRFDAATGQRDASFELDYTGFTSLKTVVGDTLIALIGVRPTPDPMLRIYTRDTGRFVGSFPDDYGSSLVGSIFNGTAVGDQLYAHAKVPVANGAEEFRAVRIDLKTGSVVTYTASLGPFMPCDCRPFLDGERLFTYREVNGAVETIVINTTTGNIERRLPNWHITSGWHPIRLGGRLVVPQIVAGVVSLVALNEDTLENEETLASDVVLPYSVGALTASADRLYAWFHDQTRTSDGRVLTGVVGLDTSGKVVSTSTPQLGSGSVDNVGSGLQAAPDNSQVAVSPAVEEIQRQLEAAAGQVTIRGVERGSRSLTVHFAPNGNKGPFEVRQVGGKKVCSTSTSSCTFKKLAAYSSYSFVVEAKDTGPASMSSPSARTKPIVSMKKGKTLRLSTVIKPATKKTVKWKVSKACKLNGAKTVLTAPKKTARCNVSVSSKSGKKTVTRSISVVVG
ncbi:MAG: hypothetical protein RLY50_1065, partial [Actinomycetota bacterium]